MGIDYYSKIIFLDKHGNRIESFKVWAEDGYQYVDIPAGTKSIGGRIIDIEFCDDSSQGENSDDESFCSQHTQSYDQDMSYDDSADFDDENNDSEDKSSAEQVNTVDDKVDEPNKAQEAAENAK